MLIFLTNLQGFDLAGETVSLACSQFLINPIMVEGYAALFSCTAVVQASNSMTASV